MSPSIRLLHECECMVCREENDPDTVQYHRQINLLLSRLNEPQRRWYVAVLSREPGAPSDVQLSHITGIDEKTIWRGRQELDADLLTVPLDRQRVVGGGRPAAEKKTRHSKRRSCSWSNRIRVATRWQKPAGSIVGLLTSPRT